MTHGLDYKAIVWLNAHPDAFTGGEFEGDPITLNRYVSIPMYVRKEVERYNRNCCDYYCSNLRYDDDFGYPDDDIAHKASYSYDDLRSLGVC